MIYYCVDTYTYVRNKYAQRQNYVFYCNRNICIIFLVRRLQPYMQCMLCVTEKVTPLILTYIRYSHFTTNFIFLFITNKYNYRKLNVPLIQRKISERVFQPSKLANIFCSVNNYRSKLFKVKK